MYFLEILPVFEITVTHCTRLLNPPNRFISALFLSPLSPSFSTEGICAVRWSLIFPFQLYSLSVILSVSTVSVSLSFFFFLSLSLSVCLPACLSLSLSCSHASQLIVGISCLSTDSVSLKQKVISRQMLCNNDEIP